MGSLRNWLSDHVVDVVVAAFTLGSGVLSFLLADAGEAWEEHPGAMVITAACAISAGALCASNAPCVKDRAERKRAREELDRACACLSQRQMSLVRELAENGSRGFEFDDSEALSLVEIGVAGASRVVDSKGRILCFLKPRFALEVRRDPERYLGGR